MEYKPRVILITTNSLHHQFLIKTINKNIKVELIVFFIKEKKKIIKNKFYQKEFYFEKKFFFMNKNYHIENCCFYFDDVNSNKLIEKIKLIKPKVGILFGTKKVRKNLIQIFKKNLINIHRGIMEKYRGLDSEFWASYYKDYKNIGSTIHYVNPELDKGKIIYQKRLKLKKNMKSHQLKALTTEIVSNKINNVINKIVSNEIATKKKQKVGNYFSKIDFFKKKKAIKNFDLYCKKIKK